MVNSTPGPQVLWTVISDGRNPAALYVSLATQGWFLSAAVGEMVNKNLFQPTIGNVYSFVGIRREELLPEQLLVRGVLAQAEEWRYLQPTLESGFLLAEHVRPGGLRGYRVAVMHKPIDLGTEGHDTEDPDIEDQKTGPVILGLDERGVYCWYAHDDYPCNDIDLFLFLAPMMIVT